jgi:hypothetical protein
MRSPGLFALLCAFVMLTIPSCELNKYFDDDDEVSDERQISYELAENAVLPSSLSNLSNTTILQDSIILEFDSEPYPFSTGMIILDTMQGGYLRKIEKIYSSNQKVILKTTQATIKDAFKDLYIKDKITVENHSPGRLKYKSSLDTSYREIISGKAYQIKLSCSNMTIDDFNYKSNSAFEWGFVLHDFALNIYDDEAKLAFSLECERVSIYKNIDFDFELKHEFFTPKYFRFIKLEENNILFENASLSGSIAFESEIKVNIINLPVLAFIPVGPVIITVGFDCDLGYFAEMTVSNSVIVNCHAGYSEETKSGFIWDYQTGYQGVDDKQVSINGAIDNTNIASTEAELTYREGPFLEPAIDVSFYGVIGPEFYARVMPINLTVTYPPLSCSLETELELGIRLEMTLFDMPVFEFSGIPWSQKYCECCGQENILMNPPILESPLNLSVDIPLDVTFIWSDENSGNNYKLQISGEEEFSGMYFEESDISEQNLTIPSGLLINNTDYFWRVRSQKNNAISPWSEVWQFKTAKDINLPDVATLIITEITNLSAISGGEILGQGISEVIERGVCWNTNPNPTLSNPHTTDGSGIGTFTSQITGLSPNTPYHVRAYATNSSGTAYGDEKSFTTLSDTPPSNGLVPLAVGNYWIYQPEGLPMTETVTIQGSQGVQGVTCFEWFAQGDTYPYLLANRSDGCWCYGYGLYQQPPDLRYKYPVEVNDTWVTSWVAPPYPTSVTCLSTNASIGGYTNCIVYNFYLPMKYKSSLAFDYLRMNEEDFPDEIEKKYSGFDIYDYYIPGIGMVGWETYLDGALFVKAVLVEYDVDQ